MRFQSCLSVQCMQTKQETDPALSMGSVKEVELYSRCFESTDLRGVLRFLRTLSSLNTILSIYYNNNNNNNNTINEGFLVC